MKIVDKSVFRPRSDCGICVTGITIMAPKAPMLSHILWKGATKQFRDTFHLKPGYIRVLGIIG